MDRDRDAIRKILLAVKDSDQRVNTVDGIDDATFKFNTMLMIQAGLVDGDFERSTTRRQAPSAAEIFSLTWSGSDFLRAATDETVWEKAKEVILKPSGSWTFEVLKKYLEKIAIAKLGDLVGL